MTDEHDKMVKYVSRSIDEDTRTFEVHELAIIPGVVKVIEFTYRRKTATDGAETR